MLEAITFLGYQISGADTIGFDLIPGSFLLSERSLKALEKAVVLLTASFLQATAIFSAEQKKKEFANSFIPSWKLSQAPKGMIYQWSRIVACVL